MGLELELPAPPPSVYRTTTEQFNATATGREGTSTLIMKKRQRGMGATGGKHTSAEEPVAGYGGKIATFPTGLRTRGQQNTFETVRHQDQAKTSGDAVLRERLSRVHTAPGQTRSSADASIAMLRNTNAAAARASTPAGREDKLDVGISDPDGNVINLRKMPWPSERPHTVATTRQDQQEGSAPRVHAVDMRPAEPVRPTIPPGYGAHVPKIKIKPTTVGKGYGDQTEEHFLKRVVKDRQERVPNLQPTRARTSPFPDKKDVLGYKKDRPPLGIETKLHALQKANATKFKRGLPRGWEKGRDVPDISTKALMSNPGIVNDQNKTPFPPKPSFRPKKY